MCESNTYFDRYLEYKEFERYHEMDLVSLINEVETDIQTEKEKEAKNKIRYVLSQLELYRKEMAKLDQKKKKLQDRHDKALQKLEQIKQGNLEVLQSIDTTKKLSAEDEKEVSNG